MGRTAASPSTFSVVLVPGPVVTFAFDVFTSVAATAVSDREADADTDDTDAGRMSFSELGSMSKASADAGEVAGSVCSKAGSSIKCIMARGSPPGFVRALARILSAIYMQKLKTQRQHNEM
jgi:hypothetical protein